MKGDPSKLKNQERKIAAAQIYQAALIKWQALSDSQKQQLLNYLNTWDIATHTPAENALYGGLLLVIVSLGQLLSGGDNGNT